MRSCPGCESPHDKPGTFCSRRCANSRIGSDKWRASRSEAVQKSNAVRRLNVEDRKRNSERMKLWTAKRLLSRSWESLTYQTQRRRLLVEQSFKCARCGRDIWLGVALPLEREHKDGNNKNNARENVEMICPNCHAITPTWRRNKTRRTYFGARKNV